MTTRYELSEDEQNIKQEVEHLFGVNPVSRDISASEYTWEVEWIDIEEIDAESEDHEEQSNVALRERRVAVENAQLTVGEGHPIVVLTEENTLIEGFTRYQLLRDQFEESEVPVYRGIPVAEANSETQTTVSTTN